jgi:hypothetical protein
MAERFKAPVLKTGMGASPSWVRIPLSPPIMTFFQWFIDVEPVGPLISPRFVIRPARHMRSGRMRHRCRAATGLTLWLSP